MASAIYEEVRNQALNLPASDQLRLIEELANVMRLQAIPRRKRHIMEFEGLGAEMWRQIDAEKYIEEERGSWEH